MKLDLLVVSDRFAWVEERMKAVLPATVEGVAWQIRPVKVKDIVPELEERPDHVPVWLLEWSDRAPAREAFDIIGHQSRSKGRQSGEGTDASAIPPLVLVLTRRPDDQSVRAIWQWSYPRLGAILYDQVLDKPAEFGGAGFLADLLAREVRLRPHLRELENLPSEPICAAIAPPVDQEPLFVTLGWGRAMQRFVADLRRLVAAMRTDWVKNFQRPPDLEQRIRGFLRRENQQPLESLFHVPMPKGGHPARSDRTGKWQIELPSRPANYAPLHLLLTGETGTGKTLLARLVSDLLEAKPMVSVNASGLSETLLEYELFGCKEGTATDVGLRPGYVLSALGGVLFFDEIGDIPLPLQARLLTFLDELRIRVNGFEGMTPSLPLYVIAATNQPLEEKIEKHQFRADLYQRFRLRIAIPSMAERKEDIPALAKFALQRRSVNFTLAEGSGRRPIDRVTHAFIEALKERDFSAGNFRQMEALLTQAVTKAAEEYSHVLHTCHLPEARDGRAAVSHPVATAPTEASSEQTARRPRKRKTSIGLSDQTRARSAKPPRVKRQGPRGRRAAASLASSRPREVAEGAFVLSDRQWQALQEVLPQRPPGGRPGAPERSLVEGVFWKLGSGKPWRALPRRYGHHLAARRRWIAWETSGAWPAIRKTFLASLPPKQAAWWDQQLPQVARA